MDNKHYDNSELKNVIQSYTPPSIYVFWSMKLDGLLGRDGRMYGKVGYTEQPVSDRLTQWINKEHFDDILQNGHYFSVPAFVTGNTFVKDFAIHHQLTNKYGFEHVPISVIPDGMPKSSEIFTGAGGYSSICDAVTEIIENFQKEASENDGRIAGEKTYEAGTGKHVIFTYTREDEWTLRDPQKKVLKKFKKAVKFCSEHHIMQKFLLNAVCRFGKTYTAMKLAEKHSRETGSKLTVILTAKTDVHDEWQAGVEKPGEFDGWKFIDAERANRIIDEHNGDTDYIGHLFNDSSVKHVVVFMSLQDLNGSLNGSVKRHHESLFAHADDIGMMLCDETHYGVRAAKLRRSIADDGSIIDNDGIDDSADYDRDDDERVDDSVLADDMEKLVDGENAKLKYKCRVDISATPHKIIASGEYSDEQIIANVTLTDMYEYQRKGIIKNFPELIMFAQDVDAITSRALKKILKIGSQYKLNELFKTQPAVHADGSAVVDDNGKQVHRFVHEQDVLDLLLTIDGAKTNDGFMGFLNDDTLNDGNLLQTIMTVLPRRNACDALEDMIKKHSDEFSNLGEYDIINVSSARVDSYGNMNGISGILQKIRVNANSGKRTMILTVNKMLTGVTIPELTAMFYMKDTTSSQEYYQAMGRLFSSWVRNVYSFGLSDEDGNGDNHNNNNTSEKTKKFDCKKNVLFVDFDMERECRMVVELAKNMLTADERRNGKTNADALQKIFEYIPVFTMNANKIVRCDPVDILASINKHRGTGINRMVTELPVDDSIINSIEEGSEYEDYFLNKLAPLDKNTGNSIAERLAKSKDGEQSSADIPEHNEDNDNSESTDNNVDTVNNVDKGKKKALSREEMLLNQVKSYYRLLLLFTVFTDSPVYALADIIRAITPSSDNNNSDNRDCRIADNLGVRVDVCDWMQHRMSVTALDNLDAAIMGVRSRIAAAGDDKIEKLKRVREELKTVNPLTGQEVMLPYDVAYDIISGALVDGISGRKNKRKFREQLRGTITGIITSTRSIMDWSCDGVFTCALYDYATRSVADGGLGLDRDMVARSLTAAPTSGLSYEIIRYTYECLGIPVGNIAGFTLGDMLDAATTVKTSRSGKSSSITRNYDIINGKLHDNNVHMLADVHMGTVDTVDTGLIVNSAGNANSGNTVEENRVEIGLIVGNPPYQSERTGAENSMSPLYNLFMDTAKTVSPEYLLVTPARFLFNQGKTNKSWNQAMLNDPHYQVTHYYADSSTVFKDTDIKGGIAVSHYNRSENYEPIKKYSPNNVIHSILVKTSNVDETGMNTIIDEQPKLLLDKVLNDYPNLGITSRVIDSNYIKDYPEIFLTNKPDDGCTYAECFGRYNNERCSRWIREDYVDTESQGNYDKYKLLIPHANGSGKLGERLSSPFIAPPKTLYTRTYIADKGSESLKDEENSLNYVKTKYARLMLGTLKTTQNNTKDSWANIPVQDFTENSDIDWTKTIQEIDKQLYKKYHLTAEESKYIEDNVQPMD